MKFSNDCCSWLEVLHQPGLLQAGETTTAANATDNLKEPDLGSLVSLPKIILITASPCLPQLQLPELDTGESVAILSRAKLLYGQRRQQVFVGIPERRPLVLHI